MINDLDPLGDKRDNRSLLKTTIECQGIINVKIIVPRSQLFVVWQTATLDSTTKLMNAIIGIRRKPVKPTFSLLTS